MCYSPVHARLDGEVVFHCLPRFELERARNTLEPYAFFKTCTSRNVRNGAGRTYRNRAFMHKQLAGFADFNTGLIISEKDQNDLVKNFFMTQKATIHDSKYGTTRVLFAST